MRFLRMPVALIAMVLALALMLDRGRRTAAPPESNGGHSGLFPEGAILRLGPPARPGIDGPVPQLAPLTAAQPFVGRPPAIRTVSQMVADFRQQPAARAEDRPTLTKIRPDRRRLPPNPDALPDGERPLRVPQRDVTGRLLGRFTMSFPNVDVVNATDIPYTPPDTMGDLGPSQYLVTINGKVRSVARVTGMPDGVLDVSLDAFFGRTNTGDPRVRYDRRTGRWFVVAFTIAVPNSLLLAVSHSSVITSSTSWTIHEWANTRTAGGTPGAAGCLADYPTLGIDEDALYIGVNQFCGGNLGTVSFDSTSAYVVRKSALPSTLFVSQFDSLMSLASPSGPYTPQGVDNADSGTDTGYFIGVDGALFSRLQLRRVFSPGGTPSMSGNIAVNVPTTSMPINVAQPGVLQTLAGNDDRLLQALIRDGRLWTMQSLGVTAAGTASGTATRTATRWYELQNLGVSPGDTPPGIRQTGTIYDASSQALSYWMASLNINGQGHVAMGMTRAGGGVDGFANVAVTGRLSSDSLGTMDTPTLVTSNSAFTLNTGYQPSSAIKRWGDYSHTSVDPNDDMSLWTIQEYITANNRWALRLVRLLAPPPATLTSVSPSTIATGQTNVAVTVTGLSTAGSGFFDPGAGFASRPSATFSGTNVIVTGVTVNSPTQATLTVSTVGAGTGARTLTFTNPDGQTTALAAALTVSGVAPTSWSVGAAGGMQVVQVTAATAWTALSSDSWLTLSTAGHTGPGSVVLTAAPTTSVAPRTAVATIAGETVTVTQAGGVATYTVTPASFTLPSSGGAQLVTVASSLTDAVWTAASTQRWLTVSSGGGTGSGSATLVAAGNPTVSPRTATATIAEQTVTVTQAGLVSLFTLEPSTWNASGRGSSRTVSLMTSELDAPWTASSDVPWLTVAPTAGTGPATLTVAAQRLPGVDDRTGTVTIAGHVLSVVQEPIQDEPLELTVTSIRQQAVELQWLWAGPPPDGYVLKGGLVPGETLAVLPTDSTAPAFAFTAPAGQFWVRVAGLRGGAELPASSDVMITVDVPAPPSAPVSLQGGATGSRLDLAWVNTYNGGTSTGALLEVAGALNLTIPLAMTDRFSFDGVPDGTYTFRVRSTGEGGTSAASNPVTLAFPGLCEVPEAAESFQAYTQGNIVTLRWNPPSSGPAVTRYLLHVDGPVSLVAPLTTREVRTVAPSGIYTVRVTSENPCGLGATTVKRVVTVP